MFQLEKTKKESARKAYFDSEKAEAARAEGNEFFKKGKFPEAIKCYDEGMKRTPDDDKVKKRFKSSRCRDSSSYFDDKTGNKNLSLRPEANAGDIVELVGCKLIFKNAQEDPFRQRGH